MITVVVVSYNSRNYLQQCLASIQQENSYPYELIVVDNASQDGSADYVAEYFPWVRLVRSERNLGFSAGNNVAAQLAQGKYLMFLNPDTVVVPGTIDKLATILEQHPEVGIATAKILLLNQPEQINTCGNDVHLSGITLCRGAGLPADAQAEMTKVSAVSGAAFLMRRELFEALGGFDEDFFMYLEDTDLSLRARMIGATCVYVPNAVVYHDYYLRFSREKTYYLERNRYLMLLKTLHWSTLFLMLPLFSLAEVITWGYILLAERSGLNKFRAYGWVVRNWNDVMRKREQVQVSRKITDRQLLSLHTSQLDFTQTGPGTVQKVANTVFNPIFRLFAWILKILVWQ